MRTALFCAAALIAFSPLQAATVISNVTVCSGEANAACQDGQTVVIDGGRIAAVGRNVAAPAGASTIDGTGKYLTPGLIDAYSGLGMLEIDAERNSSDDRAREAEFSAAFDAQWAINPAASGIAISRLGGVTRTVSAPGPTKSLFGGYAAIISTAKADSIITRSRAFMIANLGEEGADIAGGSRGTSYVMFANALKEASALAAGRRNAEDSLTSRIDAEALIPVVQGQVPIMIHVHRAVDIRNVIKLKNQFGALRIIIAGANEGWVVADEIARARLPVIVQSFDNLPDTFERLGATMANAARLQRAGVQVALASFDAQQNVRLMNQFAGNLLSLGGADAMSEAQALSLITSAPAQILGLGDVGSIAAGKTADVVLWDGPPLEAMSAPVAVMIGGVSQPMVSRQTLLRDRYKSMTGETPYQYRK
jgi:imidazolonepropionase-like amidohydrolase